MIISYHGNDSSPNISEAERKARADGIVNEFIDGIRALEGQHEPSRPLTLDEAKHLVFLKRLREQGKLLS